MKFIIGITPPAKTKEKIIAFQRSFANNSYPSLYEPHITVKAQAGLTEDLKWIPKIEAVVKGWHKFEIRFNGIDDFNGKVIFLKPTFSPNLIELHKKLVEAVNPDKEELKNYFELDRYNPHISLGGTGWGLQPGELSDLKIKAEAELIPVPAFEVTFLRVYQQLLPEGQYEKFIDLPL